MRCKYNKRDPFFTRKGCDNANILYRGREAECFERDPLGLERRKVWKVLPIVTNMRKTFPRLLSSPGKVRETDRNRQASDYLQDNQRDRQTQTRDLSSLLEVFHNFASTLEFKSLLGLILDQLKVMTEYDGATIATVDGEQLVIIDYRGTGRQSMLGWRFSLKQLGLIWEKIGRREVVIVDDVYEETHLALAYQQAIGDVRNSIFAPTRAWMAVPIILKERVMGVLNFSSREPGYFTPRHAALALGIANQAAVAIENARLYAQAQQLAPLEERQKLARELHDSVSQALYGISLGAHTARTALERGSEHVVEPLDYVLSPKPPWPRCAP